MDKRIIKIIRETKWWQGDAPVVFQLLYAPAVGFSKIVKYYPSLGKWWGNIFVIENDYGYQFMDEENSVMFIKFLVEKDRKNKKYLRNKFKEWRNLEKKTFSIASEIDKTNLRQVNNKKLYKLFKDFLENLTNCWAIVLILEGSGYYFEKDLVPRIIQKYNFKERELLKELSILTTPEKISFAKEEYINILKIALDFFKKNIKPNVSETNLKKNYPDVFKKLSSHQRKFYWVRNNYSDSHIISISEFLKEVKDLLKKKYITQIKNELIQLTDNNKLKYDKKGIIKKLGLSKEILREIELQALFGWWQDERKKMNLRTGHYITLLIKEISRRMGIDYREGYYLFDEEIQNFLLKGIKSSIRNIKNRKKMMVIFMYGNQKHEIVRERDASVYKKEIFESMKRSNVQVKEELRGMVACTGDIEKVIGEVNIVLNVRNDKFKEGNILVTSMTRPDFVPLIKKAKAIITNEGGITSHAAIVSRELNIPCVVGTKIATKVLKDGDLVEVDANKGIVKILK